MRPARGAWKPDIGETAFVQANPEGRFTLLKWRFTLPKRSFMRLNLSFGEEICFHLSGGLAGMRPARWVVQGCVPVGGFRKG